MYKEKEDLYSYSNYHLSNILQAAEYKSLVEDVNCNWSQPLFLFFTCFSEFHHVDQADPKVKVGSSFKNLIGKGIFDFSSGNGYSWEN